MNWRFLRNATGIRGYLKRRSISFLPSDSAVPGQLFPSILGSELDPVLMSDAKGQIERDDEKLRQTIAPAERVRTP